MSFKTKNKIKKDSYFDNRVTLDAKYKEKRNKFNYEQDNLEIMTNELKILERNYNKFDINKNLSNIELENKIIVKENIDKIKKKINTITSLEDDIDYLLDTGNILFDYYSDKIHEKNNSSSITLIDYFKNTKNTLNENSKANMYDKYQNKLYELSKVKSTNINIDLCSQCNTEKKLFLADAKLICEKCGEETSILIDSDKPSYKDPPREVCYFAYKRINHFNEWLAQFQAKESTDIPHEVYDEILMELKKERLLNMNNLTQKKLREILKKLKKNKYYEHIPHIINKLNGKPPPIMTRETEEELRRMFKEIQIPFHKYCPPDRKNFLSYSYVLHKFVQLLELDEFLNCFLLLKSREKLHQQDQIWKQICEHLKWEYIPSI